MLIPARSSLGIVVRQAGARISFRPILIFGVPLGVALSLVFHVVSQRRGRPPFPKPSNTA